LFTPHGNVVPMVSVNWRLAVCRGGFRVLDLHGEDVRSRRQAVCPRERRLVEAKVPAAACRSQWTRYKARRRRWLTKVVEYAVPILPAWDRSRRDRERGQGHDGDAERLRHRGRSGVGRLHGDGIGAGSRGRAAYRRPLLESGEVCRERSASARERPGHGRVAAAVLQSRRV
jgi:hypothetical protein